VVESPTSKQRCYVIPVGPEHHIESLLEELLRQHHYTFWVNDMAMETANGVMRPKYPVPPDETAEEQDPCVSHVAMKVYEKALEQIASTDGIMLDKYEYRRIAQAALDGSPLEPTPPPSTPWPGSNPNKRGLDEPLRPSEKVLPSEKASGGISNMWECPNCRVFNPLLSLNCQGCKAVRPESPEESWSAYT
jgi:hypothetical protein